MRENNDLATRSSSGTGNLGDRVKSLRLGNRDGNRSSRTKYLPWIVSFVLLLTTVAFGYRAYRVGSIMANGELPAGGSTAKKEDKPATDVSPPSTPAKVAATGEVVLQSKGYITPISLVQVSPKVGGQLKEVNFKEGDIVTQDFILARIEKVDYQADRDQAFASWQASVARHQELEKSLPEELSQAKAELDEAQKSADQLKLDYDRNRRLAIGSALTQKELEQAKYTYEGTLAKIRKLETSIRMIEKAKQIRLLSTKAEANQAEAVYTRAEARLSWTDIKAPIAGTILTKKAELGNIVNPSAFSSGISASLCEMADLTQLEVDLSIQERDIAVIKKGQFCFVMPEAYQGDKEFLTRYPRGYEGFVSRLMPTADRAKGAIPVRVKIKSIPVEEAGKFLRPDMGALVSFFSSPPKDSQSPAQTSNDKPSSPSTIPFPPEKK